MYSITLFWSYQLPFKQFWSVFCKFWLKPSAFPFSEFLKNCSTICKSWNILKGLHTIWWQTNSLQQGLEYHHLKIHYFGLNLWVWITLLYSKLQCWYFVWQYDFKFRWAVQSFVQIGEIKFLTFFVYIFLLKIY